jgi:predicted NACHT family NTPase
LQLSEAISSVISIGFPERAAPEKNNIPLYMPLKISLVGDSLVGKTTLSQKIAQKYGIVFINPVSIIS